MQRRSYTWLRRSALLVAAGVIIAAFVLALLPKPISVEVATVTRGPLRVTVNEEGKSQVRDVYTVSAPTTGRVLRISLEPGDEVVRNETPIAVIQPMVPPFLDVRDRLQLEAQIKAAQASVDLARATVRQATVERQFAEKELDRTKSLERKGVVAERTAERAQADVDTRSAELAKAEANLELHQRELEQANARRVGPDHPAAVAKRGECCVEVRAPVSGRILKVIQRSEQVVAPGVPLLEIGNPEDLEVVVELLSSDAVQVRIGAQATIENWGGNALAAQVERIEPSAFTKVSALGIEEQRVRVILKLTGSTDERLGLGHDYRVIVRIVTYEAQSAVRVPQGALFRQGGQWAVFKVRDGRAELNTVELGQRNPNVAEVQSGLVSGDVVILHPSDRVADGVRVERRLVVHTSP